MADIYSHSFAAIPKDLKIFESLVYKYLTHDTDEGKKFYFEETDDYWIVPRYFPQIMKEIYGLPYEIEYGEIEPQPIKFECNIEPRNKDQEEAIKFLSQPLQRFGILKARPGFGKTVCTIKAIHNLGHKALIVVDQEKLARQWIDAFLKFTSLTEDDIGFIAGRLDEEVVLKSKICIAIVHTLANRYLKRDKEIHLLMKSAGIGTVVFDECHVTVPTPYFQKAQGILYANRYIGLSATPFRDDDFKTKMIYYTLSNKIVDIGDYELKPIIYELYFTSTIPEKTKRWITWGDKFILQRYLKKVVESPVYTSLILGLIKEAVEDDRHVLILAPRKETLEILANLLETTYKINDIGFFWSGRPKSELNKQVIFATTQVFNKGIDVPRLDTLIVLDQFAEKSTLEQMLGRILRTHHEKKQPKAIFLVDKNFELQHFLSLKRRKLYKELGFQFQVIDLERTGNENEVK